MAIAADIFTDRDTVEALFEAGIAQSAKLGRPILVSHTEQIDSIEPIEVFRRGRHLTDTAFYWARPDKDFTQVGVGSAFTIRGEGAERFEQAAHSWKHLLEEALIYNPADAWGSGPALFGGFSFDPTHESSPTWKGFGDAALVLPQIHLTSTGNYCYLTVNTLLSADDSAAEQLEQLAHLYAQLETPAPLLDTPVSNKFEIEELLSAETWKEIVRETAADVAAGKYRKVVLARAAKVRGEVDFEVGGVLARLQASYPSAIVFAISRGEKCFAGATPERLVRLEAGQFQTMALAGSIARGHISEEDFELGQQLLNSAKDRDEHAVVVDTIKEAVSKVCVEVNAPTEPQLLKLRNLQHLYTPITGKLAENNSILQLVGQLHPTPAVGGLPRLAAMELIREREQLDRGWYAAPIGWLDRRCDGEFAVALRSALLEGPEATLFAGCGIMGDSNPESEYAESNLKMRVMLNALEEN